MVADVLPIQGEAETPPMNAVVLQGSQDHLPRHRFIPGNLNIPHEEGPDQHRRSARRDAYRQGLTVPQLCQRVGRALPPHDLDRAVQLFRRAAEDAVIPPAHAAGKRLRPFPFQIPEGQLPGGAQIQHPLRVGTRHPEPHLSPGPVDKLLQHGTHSTPLIFPPIRSSSPVIATSVSRSPRIRRTPKPVLASICVSL